MDCSIADPKPDAEAGYATAAAALTALALSLVVSAVTGASLTDLRAARAALARTRTEAALDGAQLSAIAALLDAGTPSRLRWFVLTSQGPVEVLAEPEWQKLSLSAAADLNDGELRGLGSSGIASVRAGLRAMALSGGSAAGVAKAAPTPLWRACAPSLMSPYGRATSLTLHAAGPPTSGRFSWRAGEVWRLRALSPDGWADDRIVRLTGDAEHPAAIIERTFARGQKGGQLCRIFIEAGA